MHQIVCKSPGFWHPSWWPWSQTWGEAPVMTTAATHKGTRGMAGDDPPQESRQAVEER